jgi:predicted DNA-binding transcriptional regulator YafY
VLFPIAGMKSTIPLKFEYINWEGKREERSVRPMKVWHGSTKWHKKKQWFLKAHDLKKDSKRDFALRDIVKFL